MKILTLRFGPLEIREEQVISVPPGLIGFPDHKRFVLLEHKKGSPFLWFQSVEDEALAFVLVDPLLFRPDYEIQVSPEDRKMLGLSEACEGLQSFVIVNISPDDPVQITANLLGPLLINTRNKLARQIVLYSNVYSTRTPLTAAGK